MYYETSLPSPLGSLLLGSDGQALQTLAFGDSPRRDALPLFLTVADWLQVYWQGRDPGPVPVALDPRGTPFQKAVWDQIRAIPYGETRTYGQLAAGLGKPGAAQAVGQAAGKNPIAILIPCHRVLGKGNRLTGYAWGPDIKTRLLALEGRKLP